MDYRYKFVMLVNEGSVQLVSVRGQCMVSQTKADRQDGGLMDAESV